MITDLKLRRMKAGLKQLEVFKMTGIDRSRLSLIENGWIDPKQDEIKKIEKVISAYAKTE